MKNRILASTFVLAAAIGAGSAMAQTGRPAEAPAAPSANASVIDTSQDAAGSYAHYLMLNGTPRAEAIRAAQAIDHPQPRQFAWHKEGRSANKSQ